MSGRQRLEPRKQPRQVRAELTRQRILTAAAHVFAEYGYAAGTTNRIAERARVSIGSLYQYFPNKDAILAELLIKHLEDGMAGLHQRQAEELPSSIEGILRVFVQVTISAHLQDPRLLRIMTEEAPRSPELIAKMSEFQAELITYTETLLRTHPEVNVGDIGIAARLIVSTVELVVHQMISVHELDDLDRFEDELVAMLSRYLTGGAAARRPPG